MKTDLRQTDDEEGWALGNGVSGDGPWAWPNEWFPVSAKGVGAPERASGRTARGFVSRAHDRGRAEVDSEWELRLFLHRDEIEAFLKEHPELRRGYGA